MRRPSAILLRLFTGLLLGMVFFTVTGLLLPASPAERATGLYLAVFLPLASGLVCGWIGVDLLSTARWQWRWKPQSTGRAGLFETRYESALKSGLRDILGPCTPCRLVEQRLRSFMAGWAGLLLDENIHDEWTWDFYAVSLELDLLNEAQRERLRDLLIVNPEPGLTGVRIGLRLFEGRERDDDLVSWLGWHSLRLCEGGELTVHLSLAARAWVRAYLLKVDYRDQLLLPLTRQFLRDGRTDAVAGRIYLDAYRAGHLPRGILAAMKQAARRSETMRKYPRMAEALREIGENRQLEADTGADVLLEEPEEDAVRVADSGAELEEQSEAFPGERELEDWATEPAGDVEPGTGQDRPATIPGYDVSILAEKSGRLLQILLGTAGRSLPLLYRTMDRAARAAMHRWMLVVPVILLAFVLILVLLPGGDEVEVEAPPEPVLSGPGPVTSDARYTVQVAAHSNPEAALRHLKMLRAGGLDAYQVKPVKGGSKFYRIRFGHFDSPEKAGQAADSLVAKGVIEEYFVARFEPGDIPAGVDRP